MVHIFYGYVIVTRARGSDIDALHMNFLLKGTYDNVKERALGRACVLYPPKDKWQNHTAFLYDITDEDMHELGYERIPE